MNSGELYAAFRSDVADTAQPYLWSDEEVFRYMADAYRMFVRDTGGIADSTSDVCRIQLIAGSAWADHDPRILKFRDGATLESSGRQVELRSIENLSPSALFLKITAPGPVRYMVTGEERNKVRVVQIPVEDDAILVPVYRLPLDEPRIGQTSFEFDEIDTHHHEHLLLWMKSRAYGKQDADAFDRSKRDEYKTAHDAYCLKASAEMARQRHKNRTITYGGL
ncbi:MAG: hypothetical protein LBV29_02925 [Azoarcus sp.]|nr:hypothetical protein [Azoarcus sp.]